MIHDQVGHDAGVRRERRDVSPGAETVIDLCMVGRIEACIGAIDRMKERQHVDAAEQAVQRPVEQLAQMLKGAARQAVDIRDQ